MRTRILGAAVLAALVTTGVSADSALKSGPQAGSTKILPFNPLHCSGPTEGTKQCLVWKNGGNPVAMIFAREISGPLTSLVKKIDKATAANTKARMGSFVVFLSDEEGMKDKLKKLATDEHLKKCVLSLDNPAGPPGYDIAKDADVTVVLYNNRKVKSNYAFRKGELNDAAVAKVVADIPKILPKSE